MTWCKNEFIDVQRALRESFHLTGFFLSWLSWALCSITFIAAELSVHCCIGRKRRYLRFVTRSRGLKAPLESVDRNGNTLAAFECNLISLVFFHFLTPDKITVSSICVDYGRGYNDRTLLEVNCYSIGSPWQIHWEIDSIACLHAELSVCFLRSSNSNSLRVWIEVIRYDLLAL